jgi:hypothetical protein
MVKSIAMWVPYCLCTALEIIEPLLKRQPCNPELKVVIVLIADGYFSREDRELFRPLVNSHTPWGILTCCSLISSPLLIVKVKIDLLSQDEVKKEHVGLNGLCNRQKTIPLYKLPAVEYSNRASASDCSSRLRGTA